MVEKFLSDLSIAFLGLFPILNPFAVAAVFLSLTADMAPRMRRRQAARACLIAAVIMLTVLFLGAIILDFFGISVVDLRIAGGLVLCYVGFKMLFPPETAGAADAAGNKSDFAFVPLAMPLLSGPGSFAVLIGMSAEIAPDTGIGIYTRYAAVVLAVVLAAFISWLVLRGAHSVVRFLGPSGLEAISKFMGFILICIGINMINSGIEREVDDYLKKIGIKNIGTSSRLGTPAGAWARAGIRAVTFVAAPGARICSCRV